MVRSSSSGRVMRILWTLLFVLLSCPSVQAANDTFPAALQGYWGDTQETCASLKQASLSNLHDGQRWLKITATDVLGTTQGRFLRQIPARTLGGVPAEFSSEIQMADAFGLIVELDFLGRGYLSETMMGAHADRRYQMC